MNTAPATPDLRYPIGKFDFNAVVTQAQRTEAIEQIARLPQELRAVVTGLTDEQLATPYRPGGWTIRQVVHHVPDSHMNSYMRFKLALTEDTPTIRPYDEAALANLPEASSAPVEVSLRLLESLHERWVLMLRAMSEADWQRHFHHPGLGRQVRLDTNAALYGWHGRHHTAHITGLKQRMGW